MRTTGFVLAVLLGSMLVGSTLARACELPVPFEHVYQNNVVSSVDATSCALSVSMTTASRSTAAAFFHYRRPSPLTSVRYGFRVDASGLAGPQSAADWIQLFAATSPVVAYSIPASAVLRIYYRLDSTPPTLFFYTPNAANKYLAQAQLSGSINTIRVQIDVGTAGNIRYWINHAFSDPPDGVLGADAGAEVDNSALVGVIGADIGVSNASPHYLRDYVGQSLVIDQLESNDDVLFYDDFSTGAQ